MSETAQPDTKGKKMTEADKKNMDAWHQKQAQKKKLK